MRPKRKVKVRMFKRLPHDIYDKFIKAPALEWEEDPLSFTLWPNIMMGAVYVWGSYYYFRVNSFNGNVIDFDVDCKEFDEYLQLELKTCIRHGLAYLFGYLNVKEFNFKVKYEDVV